MMMMIAFIQRYSRADSLGFCRGFLFYFFIFRVVVVVLSGGGVGCLSLCFVRASYTVSYIWPTEPVALSCCN